MKQNARYDYSKLKGKIKELFDTQENFALALGIGRVSLSQRLNGKLQFSQKEMDRAVEILKLKKSDIPSYFFDVNTSVHGEESEQTMNEVFQ